MAELLTLFMLFAALLAFLLIAFLRLIIWGFAPYAEVVCRACGNVSVTRKRLKGSSIIEIILWLFFLVPGIIYSVWRLLNRAYRCKACGSFLMIPTSSPVGKEMTAKHPGFRER